MRFRVWRVLTALAIWTGAGLVSPAAAQSDANQQSDPYHPRDPYQTSDMLGMLGSVARQDSMRGTLHPTFWLDIGAAIPVSSFQDRDWTNGFVLQLGHEIWTSGIIGVDGRLGFFFNENSSFNEAQTDSYYSAGPGFAGTPVVSQRHLLVPFSVEVKLEGTNPSFSPFVAAGPSINWSRETTAYQDSTIVLPVAIIGDDWPTDDPGFIPTPGALTAHSVKNNTKIHPGYGARGGIRFRFANSAARLMVSLNSWYERSHPISVVGAYISFGI